MGSWGWVAAAFVLAQAAPMPVGPVAPGALTTSDACGACHKDIHRTWRESAHARSMEDDVFLDSYRDAASERGPEIARTCLPCHAPMVEVNGDFDLERKITWEGVSCDVCHSLVRVDVSGATPRNVYDVGPRKRGPIRDADPVGHEAVYSELHTQSLGCAGCHEYANPEGTPILTTYSEWRESEAAVRGVHCQGCHMARTRARVVDPRVLRESHAEINLHDVPGGHSLEQLHKAIRVSLEPRREADELVLEVRLHNRGAGHAVPTGMPGRRVVLDVEVRDSRGGSARQERAYGKFYSDAAGRRIVRDRDYFARGVRLDEDTRLRPDETRAERFQFPIAADAIAFVSLRLHYEHAPTGGPDNRTWLTFYSEDRTLVPGAPPAS
jgi:hypothetical protein